MFLILVLQIAQHLPAAPVKFFYMLYSIKHNACLMGRLALPFKIFINMCATAGFH